MGPISTQGEMFEITRRLTYPREPKEAAGEIAGMGRMVASRFPTCGWGFSLLLSLPNYFLLVVIKIKQNQ